MYWFGGEWGVFRRDWVLNVYLFIEAAVEWGRKGDWQAVKGI